MIRKTVLSLIAAAGTLGAVVVPSVSNAFVDIRVNVASPPLRYEVVPQPRDGKIWTRGYWDWRQYRGGYHHVWVGGYWVPAHRGYVYTPYRWTQRDGYWVSERSRGDRDGDGIPNRYDHNPNNPYRR